MNTIEEKINNTELQLKKIFEEDSGNLIIFYKDTLIERLAKFITGETPRSMAIGIAGESASGKSTITQEIISSIETFAFKNNYGSAITRINTDDYYYDHSEDVKKAGSMEEFVKTYDLDIPEALELELMNKHIKELLSGKEVMLPKYDMSGTTKRWDNHTLAKPSKIIISEGLFTLTDKIEGVFDFKIYVDIEEEIKRKRFFTRAEERKLGNSAKHIYSNAAEKAEIYIKPCKERADLILSGAAPKTSYQVFINKILDIVYNLYSK
jgi:uridine kinase